MASVQVTGKTFEATVKQGIAFGLCASMCARDGTLLAAQQGLAGRP